MHFLRAWLRKCGFKNGNHPNENVILSETCIKNTDRSLLFFFEPCFVSFLDNLNRVSNINYLSKYCTYSHEIWSEYGLEPPQGELILSFIKLQVGPLRDELLWPPEVTRTLFTMLNEKESVEAVVHVVEGCPLAFLELTICNAPASTSQSCQGNIFFKQRTTS